MMPGSSRQYRNMARGRHIGFTVYLMLLLGFLVSGCTFVPTSGPTVERINETLEDRNPLGLRVVKVSPIVIKLLLEEQLPLAVVQGLADPEPVGRIGVGDVLTISVFETPPALFSPTIGVPSLAGASAASSGSGATLTNIPPLEVGKDGTVEMPYGGRLRVEGLTPTEVEGKIAALLKNKSIAPQVIVTISKNVANTVFVSGDVVKPGRYPLDLQAEHLLDIVTLAGGPREVPYDEAVELVRGDTQIVVRLSDVTPLGTYNFVLAPGDRVVVLSRPRTFTVFGSAGRVSEIDFKSPTVTLADALARAQAATGVESDATGIYLFRFEDPKLAKSFGLNAGNGGLVPVIYRINLMDPTSYVLLTQFRMRNKDLIYVAGARSVPLQKFLALVADMFTPLTPAASIGQVVAYPP